jgi:hypothetical protein
LPEVNWAKLAVCLGQELKDAPNKAKALQSVRAVSGVSVASFYYFFIFESYKYDLSLEASSSKASSIKCLGGWLRFRME